MTLEINNLPDHKENIDAVVEYMLAQDQAIIDLKRNLALEAQAKERIPELENKIKLLTTNIDALSRTIQSLMDKSASRKERIRELLGYLHRATEKINELEHTLTNKQETIDQLRGADGPDWEMAWVNSERKLQACQKELAVAIALVPKVLTKVTIRDENPIMCRVYLEGEAFPLRQPFSSKTLAAKWCEDRGYEVVK